MAVRNYGKNQIIAKQENITLIKSLLYRYGPLSRAQIAEMLELTPPTITNITAELITDGILQEIPDQPVEKTGKAGRHPVLLDYVPDAKYALGISLGRDRTHYCICDLKGNMAVRGEEKVMPADYGRMMQSLCRLIDSVRDSHPGLWSKLIGIGVAVPAVVDAHTGTVCQIDSHRSSWQNQRPADEIAERYGLPVRIENNVRARTILLSLFYPEAVAGCDSFVLCYASWGIAGPMILQNRSVRGEYGAAGEIGHMVMDPVSGKTLEEFSSLRYVLKTAGELLKEGKAPVLAEICSDPEKLTVDHIHQAQTAGDADIGRLMDSAMHYIGTALANIISFMNPDLIVLGGPMFALEQNRNTAEQVMRRYSYSADTDHTQIRYVFFDEYGGAAAAAAVCLDKYFVR